MPHISQRGRKQTAVFYTRSHYDENGNAVLSSPVEESVRWEKGNPLELTPTEGVETFDITMWVDQSYAVGSIVWIGALADLPATPTNLKEVVDYQEIPDVRGRVKERIVLLRKWNNKRPDLSS